MALGATLHVFDTQIADVDRGVYETLGVRVARQPSETPEFMLTRYLAYCLEYADGIAFTEGVAAGEEPAIVIRDLTGRITAWIEVGLPPAHRLHRGSKIAGRAAVYTHREVAQVLSALREGAIHRAAEIPVYEFGRGFVGEVAAMVPRRAAVSLSITERQLYLDVDGRSFSTTVRQHRIG